MFGRFKEQRRAHKQAELSSALEKPFDPQKDASFEVDLLVRGIADYLKDKSLNQEVKIPVKDDYYDLASREPNYARLALKLKTARHVNEERQFGLKIDVSLDFESIVVSKG